MITIVRPLTPDDAQACDAIMRSLPDFFGYEPGLAACAEAVRTQDGWVADNGQVAGFATWQPRTSDSAEITWMAVERDRRQAGVGTAIIERLVADARTWLPAGAGDDIGAAEGPADRGHLRPDAAVLERAASCR